MPTTVPFLCRGVLDRSGPTSTTIKISVNPKGLCSTPGLSLFSKLLKFLLHQRLFRKGLTLLQCIANPPAGVYNSLQKRRAITLTKRPLVNNLALGAVLFY